MGYFTLDVINQIDGVKCKSNGDADTNMFWGTIDGDPMYARVINKSLLPSNCVSTGPMNGEDVAYVFESPMDTDNYLVMVAKYPECYVFESKLADMLMANVATIRLGSVVDKSANSAQEFNERLIFWSYVYVPFNDGPNGSRIPIMWRVPDGSICDVISISEDTAQNGMSIEFVHEIKNAIAAKFPSVDLPAEEDKRYVTTELNGIFGELTVAYNRNNIGYNGKSNDVVSTAAILFNRMAVGDYANVYFKTNLIQVLSGSIPADEYYFNSGSTGEEVETSHVNSAMPETPVIDLLNTEEKQTHQSATPKSSIKQTKYVKGDNADHSSLLAIARSIGNTGHVEEE